MNALDIKHLSKRYVDFELQELSLSLPTGCIMGFIGENGSGKTTTINLILDLIKRDAGEIFVFGSDNRTGFTDVKEHVGVVLDESNFPESLSTQAINGIMKRIYKTWDETRYFNLCDRFSLPKSKAVKDYSRGMKMKLGIAAALSHDTRLLIMDEATSGLDPIVRDEILDMLLEFIQDETHAVFISSHIISDLEKISDYIAFIHQGRLLFCEEKDVLLDKYAIVKCAAKVFSRIEPKAVLGKRSGVFGVEALVLRECIPSGFAVEKASIEDIMVYIVKGIRQ